MQYLIEIFLVSFMQVERYLTFCEYLLWLKELVSPVKHISRRACVSLAPRLTPAVPHISLSQGAKSWQRQLNVSLEEGVAQRA